MNAKIQDAASTVIQARDFCGNERSALRQWEADYGKLTPGERLEVAAEVERQWNDSRSAAGVVSPVSADERRAIIRTMEAS